MSHHYIDKFVLPEHPQIYWKQHRPWYCGLFTLKAVVESFKNVHNSVKKYTDWFLRKIIWFMWTHGLVKILKKYWINANRGFCKLKSMVQKIDFLKNHLHNWPMIVIIAHGYNKKTNFNILQSIFKQHIISIWWYDDEKKIFYCYDSHTDRVEKDLPVWNIEIDYEDLVSYWWLAWLGLFRNRYVAVKYN